MKRPLWLVPWLLFAAAILVGPAAAQSPDPGTLPIALRDWVDWVRKDHEYVSCPLRAEHDGADESSYACTWPGELAIDAGADGARFTQRWQVYARGKVTLPGSGDVWPQRVRANGNAVPVVPDEDTALPVVWLEPGTYAIEGAFDWDDRPESLQIPVDVALVRLSVDGAAIFPIQREDVTLWLGRAETGSREADSLELQVFRLLQDVAVPAWLTTRIVLTVSGEGREEVLGKPLPQGWQPIALSGDLPARYDPDGTLRVQVRPGTHTIELRARATAPLVEQGRPASAAPWPDEEIWSYESNSRLRVTAAVGTNPIDPAQAGVPGEWAHLPAFVMNADATLTIEERSRGLATQDQNRLTLYRSMWLDFDGGAFGTQDRVVGSMVRDWRLDVAAPYTLERATANGEGLLVTKGAGPGLTGVELRDRNVNLEASTRLARSGGTIPITGWQHAFDSVTTTINLPPGYRLFAAIGADRAPEAWLARWNLLDVFLVAVITMLAVWLLGKAGAALVLGYLVLGYHENNAPLVAVLAVVATGLLVRVLPVESRVRRVAGWLRNLALLGLILIALPFGAEQVRLALYPQLERWAPDAATGYGGEYDYMTSSAERGAPMAPPPPPAPSAAPMEVIVQEEREAVQDMAPQSKAMEQRQMASNIGGVARKRLQRYANNTIVQAGSGQA
ncbi:MAG TPA: hypothetical protein VFO79_02455, partial [Xanthomonadales bacterium]|nr:hypothetical protein [Xanthomonadales bacterium]